MSDTETESIHDRFTFTLEIPSDTTFRIVDIRVIKDIIYLIYEGYIKGILMTIKCKNKMNNQTSFNITASTSYKCIKENLDYEVLPL